MNPTSPAATVLDEVGTWAGITTEPTSRGATAILFEGHELGHVHANRGTLDLPLPADRRAASTGGFTSMTDGGSIADRLPNTEGRAQRTRPAAPAGAPPEPAGVVLDLSNHRAAHNRICRHLERRERRDSNPRPPA
jgi:Family of unknown function (DUF5519)